MTYTRELKELEKINNSIADVFNEKNVKYITSKELLAFCKTIDESIIQSIVYQYYQYHSLTNKQWNILLQKYKPVPVQLDLANAEIRVKGGIK